MKKKIVCMLVCMLFFSTIVGAIPSTKKSTKILSEMNLNMDYSHTVFVEVATSQNCKKCHPWNQNIHDAYISGDYDFEYVKMIEYDHDGDVLNEKAHDWAINYNVEGYPTSIFDGDYERLIGNYPSLLPGKLDACGNRAVADIIANMTVTWLGDATITVNITIQNNEGTQYNGYIRACITEIESRYDTYYGDPYHFGFLDYAFDTDISINPGGVYTDNVTWYGNEHEDNHGDDFGDITPHNIQVTMGVFNDDNDYVDETVMARITDNNPPNEPSNPSPPNGAPDVDIYADLSWTCSDPDGDPLTYDVYFGASSNPPLVASGITDTTFDPGTMDFGETYYWKIVAEDNHGASTSGSIWSFTTRETENKAPHVKIIKPKRALYIFNKSIFPRLFRPAKIIGGITIEVNATDEDSGIEKVEFYINGKLKGNDTTEPYTYNWKRDRLRFFHIFIIKVKAYDNDGKTSVNRRIVRKFL